MIIPYCTGIVDERLKKIIIMSSDEQSPITLPSKEVFKANCNLCMAKIQLIKLNEN